MKLTVITDKNGTITGTIKGHSHDFIFGSFRPGLIIEKGERTYEIEVPDEYEKMDANELHKKLKEYNRVTLDAPTVFEIILATPFSFQ